MEPTAACAYFPKHRLHVLAGLDPELRTLPLPAFGNTEIDFSQAVLVFAGNHPIENAALRTRLRQITFGPLGAAQRTSIARACLSEELSNHHRLGEACTLRIGAAMEQLLPKLVQCDMDAQNAGARILKGALRAVFGHIRDVVMDGQEPVEATVQERMRDLFAQWGAGA